MEFTRLYNSNGRKPGQATPLEMVVVRPATPSFAKGFADAQLEYSATTPSKYRRTRQGLGGTADAHYKSGLKFWELREYARDMDRNDAVMGQLVDRALDNILGTGLHYDPQTGDEKLDDELSYRFNDWAQNPLLCDMAGRRDFSQLERLALRHRFIDGDSIVVPEEQGGNLYLSLLEGDRLPESNTISGDVVHGIEVDPLNDRIKNYHFVIPRPGQRLYTGRRYPLSLKAPDVRVIPAYDARGRLAVYHQYDPQRITQTRGVTVFRAIFDVMGMFEDLQFAKLIQHQVVSCIAVFVQRERDLSWGNRTQETDGRTDGQPTTFEGLSPGMSVRLKPGETIAGFSPSVPNPEFFQHARLILRMVGAALGMPLELVLMDTSDTTFHGYRGALQQAQKSFVRQQKLMPTQLHRHVINRLIDMWLPSLGKSAATNKFLRRHFWRSEGWPYVEPLNDAKADHLRQSQCLASPRRIQSERGGDWDDVKREIVEDWGSAIELACERAKKINEKFKDKDHPETQPFITWRDVLNLESKGTASTAGVDAATGFGQGRDAGGHFAPGKKPDADQGEPAKG